jgi:hypothetical protein
MQTRCRMRIRLESALWKVQPGPWCQSSRQLQHGSITSDEVTQTRTHQLRRRRTGIVARTAMHMRQTKLHLLSSSVRYLRLRLAVRSETHDEKYEVTRLFGLVTADSWYISTVVHATWMVIRVLSGNVLLCGKMKMVERCFLRYRDRVEIHDTLIDSTVGRSLD